MVLLLLLLGCREDDEAVSDGRNVTINGHVQKGPFINGTSLVITELDNRLAATGKTFTTQITDNRGSFFIKTSRLDYPNLQLIATGFYFDEVRGEKSAAQLTLFALANVSADATINVNVLSHLEKDRILYLIEQNMSFLEAKQQAQREILALFGIERDNMANSELLDITQAGEENAILLAVSAVLQSGNTVAGLSELLAGIITDIREDGVLDNEMLKATLRQNAINLDLPSVRQNLIKRYEELGLEVSIPSFEQFVDSDGDGILNKDDDNSPEEFVLAAIENAMRNTVYQSETVIVSGLPYPAIAKITNGHLIKNGQSVEGDTTYVRDGDALQIALSASVNWNETAAATLQVGDYHTDFLVRVQAYPWATALTGVIQQGPFVNGSPLTITEVDSSFAATKRSHRTTVANSKGEFSVSDIKQHHPWAAIEGKGFYFDLVSGSTSDSELSLIGYTDLSATATANVNVLTHLEHRRVRYLVNSGLSFAEAKRQALHEVLAIFEIHEEVSLTAEQFNITQNTPEGAMLLAISAMLQGYESTGTLQELLTNISEDLETDGALDDRILGSSLINNAFYIDLTTIRSSISDKYQEIDQTIMIAPFEKYVRGFVNNTQYNLTKKIEYPENGIYGKNILKGTETKLKKGSYGIQAILPSYTKLTIVISARKTLTEQPNTVWDFDNISVGNQWTKGYYDFTKRSMPFTAAHSGEVKFKIFVYDDVNIEIYENDAVVPTRVINIDAY